MNELKKRQIAVVVGSGFSASLTTGRAPLIGNQPMPTLGDLAEAMLGHLNAVSGELPFPEQVINETISILESNQRQPRERRFDFEQLLSLVAIKSGFVSNSDISQSRARLMSQVLQCLIYLIPSLFAQRLAIDGKLMKNRNLFYSVKSKGRVQAIQAALRQLVDQNEVTFITFNYDGLIEAFLDCDMGISGPGQKPVFRYFPEISHGFRMVMPEHVFGTKDTRDFSRFGKVPRVLKPHGSLPEAMFRRKLEKTLPSLELIENLADEFKTTLTATAIRYIDLCEEQCAVVFSTAEKVVWSRRSADFHRWITPGRKISSYSLAADFFERGHLSDKMETVRRDAWVENASDRETIKEQSRALRSYDSVLSLLWIPYEFTR